MQKTPRVVPIALVVSASGLTVTGPRTHTNPAKFILTHFAVHVVASLVFLDTRVAIWAFLCVGENNGKISIVAQLVFINLLSLLS